jgi:Family of unknown function (DUF5681)
MAEIAGQKQRRRGPGKPFRAGQSGNPKGKPPGTRDRATRAAEILLDGEAEALTRKGIEMALAGDTIALRLCLDRILPTRKGRPVVIDLPPMKTTADASAGFAAVIREMAAGKISPDEAQAVVTVLEAQRRVIETFELEARLRAIEERIGADEQKI